MAGKAEDTGWTTVTEESATRIIFDKVGDEFIGAYLGHDLVQGEYDYVLFRGTDGNLYSMSCGYKLQDAFGSAVDETAGKIAEGTTVRLTYVKDVPMGTGRNPMKDIKVDAKA